MRSEHNEIIIAPTLRKIQEARKWLDQCEKCLHQGELMSPRGYLYTAIGELNEAVHIVKLIEPESF